MDAMVGMKMLAVCAKEEGYSMKLAEYARSKNSCPFLVQIFSHVSSLMDYLKLRSADVVLLDETLYDDGQWEGYDGVLCLLGNGIGQEEYPPQIFKYQQARDILQQILVEYGKRERTKGSVLVSKKGMEIFGVYSPIGRCGKSRFALALGLVLAERQRTLYVNLESWSDLENWLGGIPGGSLSDLLYFLRQRREALAERLCSMTVTVNRLDLLPPARAPADLTVVSLEDWQYLFETLRCQSSYEAVVVDMGDSPQPVEKLLGMCTRVYVPTLPGGEQQPKLARFLAFIEENGCADLMPEMEMLSLPCADLPGADGVWAEQLLWSKMGDFVRELLKRGGEAGGTVYTKA